VDRYPILRMSILGRITAKSCRHDFIMQCHLSYVAAIFSSEKRVGIRNSMPQLKDGRALLYPARHFGFRIERESLSQLQWLVLTNSNLKFYATGL
jgi:hypothetical protein